VLKEFVHVRQEKGPGRRRWFESDDLELVVWLDGHGEIEGYQICYDLGKGERALTWRPRVGFAHSGVDSGERGPISNMTPILVPDGAVPWPELTERFAKNDGLLEPALRDLVQRTLQARR
jgi:hypothetical protein